MINPNKELFRWGPIPGKPIYVSYFVTQTANLRKFYQYASCDLILYFNNLDMTFICDYGKLRECSKKHFISWIMNDEEFKVLKIKYEEARKKINENCSDFKEFNQAYLEFWKHGLIPEFANWGGEPILKEKLEKAIPKKDFVRVMEKLSAPEYLSFYQEEELSLLRVKLGKKSIEEHTKEYFWIRNSYYESFILNEKDFEKELNEIENAENKIKEIINFPKKVKSEKKKIIEEFNLDSKTAKIAERLSYCIYWQDARKAKIFEVNHRIKQYLIEISKEKNIPFEDLEVYYCDEIIDLIEGKSLEKEIVESRKKVFISLIEDENIRLIHNQEEAEKFIKPYIEKKVDKNIKELKGIVASLGKVQGRSKILLNPKESDKVNGGDILIASFTSPEYIVAMRKAAAIVTDEGGITCHAAIVSRELGVPCIVNTGVATKIFKDNDLVEVDADNGIVRKIE